MTTSDKELTIPEQFTKYMGGKEKLNQIIDDKIDEILGRATKPDPKPKLRFKIGERVVLKFPPASKTSNQVMYIDETSMVLGNIEEPQDPKAYTSLDSAIWQLNLAVRHLKEQRDYKDTEVEDLLEEKINALLNEYRTNELIPEDSLEPASKRKLRRDQDKLRLRIAKFRDAKDILSERF